MAHPMKICCRTLLFYTEEHINGNPRGDARAKANTA